MFLIRVHKIAFTFPEEIRQILKSNSIILFSDIFIKIIKGGVQRGGLIFLHFFES